MGLFLRRAFAVCLLFAVLSLSAPVSEVRGQASVEITDFQYPARVAQGSEATISFTVSWTGAPEGSHVSIVLSEKGYVRGRVEQPSSCIAPEGYATCEILSPTYSGREYVKFVLDPQPLGKHQFGLAALLIDANDNTLATSDLGGKAGFFAIIWTSASTTATTTSSINTTGLYGGASTSISDLQYPAHVALGTSFPMEIPVTFSFSWTGARSGDHLVLGIALPGTDEYAGGKAYLSASCLTPNDFVGKATCVQSNLESSGRGSAEFHLWVYSRGKYHFASLVAMCDTYGHVREGSLTSSEFSVEVSPITTTMTTRALTTTTTTYPQWLTDYWSAFNFGAIVAAVLLVLYLLTRRKKVVRQALIEHPTPIAAAETEIERPRPRSTMFCRECGAKIARDSTYCVECGARLA